MRPTVRQLELAVALAERRHFGRAARQAGISQPALSAQIKQLEELFGVELFERTKRGVLLTRAGEEVVARARRVLSDLDDMAQAAVDAGEPLSGLLRLGVIPTMAPYLLPRIVPRLRRSYPRLRPLLYEDRTARLLARMHAGELDLALLALPAGGAELEARPIARDPFYLAARRDHPLAERERVRLADLEGHEVLLLEDGHCLRDQALEVCGRSGAFASSVQAGSMTTLVQMVAAGLGITLLPELAVRVELSAARDLVAVPFEEPPPQRTVGLVWRRASSRTPAYEELATLVRAAVGRRRAIGNE